MKTDGYGLGTWQIFHFSRYKGGKKGIAVIASTVKGVKKVKNWTNICQVPKEDTSRKLKA